MMYNKSNEKFEEGSHGQSNEESICRHWKRGFNLGRRGIYSEIVAGRKCAILTKWPLWPRKAQAGRLWEFGAAMSDFSRSFQPWEEGFRKGLYLAGVECVDRAEAPGWMDKMDNPRI